MAHNPYPYGYIRWARFHLEDVPNGCGSPENCSDCEFAKREVHKAAKADADVAKRQQRGLTELVEKNPPEKQSTGKVHV